ncbi:hypothetical protein FPV67DRAFT_368106 [Lyophyllum atratum]|nr:hypothetical protein FPV67DRAFT_368106 [Lyophyllum atratum]
MDLAILMLVAWNVLLSAAARRWQQRARKTLSWGTFRGRTSLRHHREIIRLRFILLTANWDSFRPQHAIPTHDGGMRPRPALLIWTTTNVSKH